MIIMPTLCPTRRSGIQDIHVSHIQLKSSPSASLIFIWFISQFYLLMVDADVILAVVLDLLGISQWLTFTGSLDACAEA